MKLPHKLVCIDIETTDANSAKGDIIQIGAVILNEDLSLGETFVTDIRPLSTHRNPEAMAVNGFTEERMEKAPHPLLALQNFEAFALQVGRRPILAAWGAYFDIPYIEAFYEGVQRDNPFSFKYVDLKSIAIWEASRRGEDASRTGINAFLQRAGMEFEGNPHDGLADILNAVRIIKNYV